MESYDVIANQPVVIDNVSCVFTVSKGTRGLLPERIASRVSVWAAGSLSLARPVRRVHLSPPPPSPTLPAGGLARDRGMENFGVNKGKSCDLSGVLGPLTRGALTAL